MKTTLDKKLSLLFVIMLISRLAAMAQNPSISGKIIDQNNKALDFVNIGLLKANDSVLVKSAITDIDGRYTFSNVTAGNYIISARMFGFKNT